MAPATVHCRERKEQQQQQQKRWGGISYWLHARIAVIFFFNCSLQMNIIYIYTASNGARTCSGISYHIFQVCNTNFNTVRMKYLGVKRLLLYHISFILRESSKCEENGPGRTSVCFWGGTICPNFGSSNDKPSIFKKLGENREWHWLLITLPYKRKERK